MFSVRIPACLPGYKGRVLGSGGAEGKEPGSFMITGGCLQNIGTSVLGDVCPRRIFFFRILLSGFLEGPDPHQQHPPRIFLRLCQEFSSLRW